MMAKKTKTSRTAYASGEKITTSEVCLASGQRDHDFSGVYQWLVEEISTSKFATAVGEIDQNLPVLSVKKISDKRSLNFPGLSRQWPKQGYCPKCGSHTKHSKTCTFPSLLSTISHECDCFLLFLHYLCPRDFEGEIAEYPFVAPY